MKIGFTGLELPEGKIRYNDKILDALSMKDNPAKVSPYYVDFLPDEFDKCDVIAIARSTILDLLIHDMEKIETRMARLTNTDETALLQRCLDNLEMDIPLYDLPLTEQETRVLATAAPFSRAIRVQFV